MLIACRNQKIPYVRCTKNSQVLNCRQNIYLILFYILLLLKTSCCYHLDILSIRFCIQYLTIILIKSSPYQLTIDIKQYFISKRRKPFSKCSAISSGYFHVKTIYMRTRPLFSFSLSIPSLSLLFLYSLPFLIFLFLQNFLYIDFYMQRCS